MTQPKSLAAFADDNPRYARGETAWITTIPEWPEVLAAWEAGLANQSQILDWLVEERGYSKDLVTRSKIAYLSKAHPRRRRA